MWLKKKKNLIILTWIVVISFILYQLYFFIAINKVNTSKTQVLHVKDHSSVLEIVHVRSEDDRYINENGLIRGILYTNMRRYRADSKNEFTCPKSGESIPFEYINDDFCDCEDSSDEPSTSACVNGTFYCDTQYQNKLVSMNSVPSSRVNDGICDCCDGSDEWTHGSGQKLLTQGSLELRRHYAYKCPNICHDI